MDRQLRDLERRAQGGDPDVALLLIQHTARLFGGDLSVSHEEDPRGGSYLATLRYLRQIKGKYDGVFDGIELELYTTFKKARVATPAGRRTRQIPNRYYLRGMLSLPNYSRDQVSIRSTSWSLGHLPAALSHYYLSLLKLEDALKLHDSGHSVDHIHNFVRG